MVPSEFNHGSGLHFPAYLQEKVSQGIIATWER